MATYRAYKLDRAGRIVAGEWFEAASDREATRTAHGLCDETTPRVELWEGARLVGQIPCDLDEPTLEARPLAAPPV